MTDVNIQLVKRGSGTAKQKAYSTVAVSAIDLLRKLSSQSRTPQPDWSLSPIQRLHSDVLLELFRWVLPEDEIDTDDLRSARTSPLNITAVCYSWRQIALMNGSLWAKIRLAHKWGRDSEGVPYTKSFPWDPFKACIRFTRKMPLVIELSLESVYWGDIDDMLEAVGKVHKRCRALSIVYSLSSDPLLLSPRMLLWEDWRELEVLRLHVPNWLGTTVIIDLSRAKRLKTLDLRVFMNFNFISDHGTQLQYLTTIDLNMDKGADYTVDTCMQLLMLAPALCTFSAAVSGRDFFPQAWRHNDRHPNLRLDSLVSLGLRYAFGFAAAPMRYVLDHLILPGIAELSVGARVNILDAGNSDLGWGDEDDDSDSEDFSTGVQLLLSRSTIPSTLARLELYSAPLDEINETLRCAQDLISLKLGGALRDSEDVRRLVLGLSLDPNSGAGPFRSPSGNLWPCQKLETITFELCDFGGCVKDLVDMIKSRWNPPSGPRCIRKIHFSDCAIGYLRQDPAIVQCVIEGLRISTMDTDL
ncbi:hypothetical protein DFH11DRAFT_1211260 [Phellopilus nigrolimitatus]|nr:hypothetical protein DFH11DRAFT_1211260 [Phellopilus nigrolimitatus]